MNIEPGSQADPLDDIVESILQRQRQGERPSLTEYVARHPDLADRLREVFPALVMVEELGSVGGPPAPMPVAPAEAPQRLGDFRILREIGRGGMGVVYEAVQESLGRHVALKVLPAHFARDCKFVERFRREARAAARLHHTNIVPVFSVGEEDGTCYYAMQYIQGQTLEAVLEVVRRLRGAVAGAAGTPTLPAGPAGRSVAEGLLTDHFGAGPLTGDDAAAPPAAATPAPAAGTTSTLSNQPEAAYFRGVARMGIQAAEALTYAHGQNVLHRDIKPSNLLLDVHGTLWVTDFGLAKAVDGTKLTRDGDLLGTFRYMAPERFKGTSDARGDVYALGVTLYEMLALRPPFASDDRAELIDQIVQGTPAPLRRLVPLLPRDLETIVQTAMARELTARYASAAEMANDLQRFLENRPIKARRSSTAENFRRWCRRNPVVAGLSAVSLSLLIVAAVGGAVMSYFLFGALGQAQDAVREGKRKLVASYVSDADATRMSGRPGQRFDSLRRLREALDIAREIGLSDADKLRLRNIAIAALCLPDVETSLEWPAGPDQPLPEGLDPVHRRMVLAGYALARLPAPVHKLHGLSWYSPDGRFVAAGTRPYIKTHSVPARVWRIDGPEPERVLDVPDRVYEQATAFRPDSRQVAFGHEDGSVSIYDTESRQRVLLLERGPGQTFCLAYHPRLPRLAVACGSEVAIWDVEMKRRLLRLNHPAMVWSVAWHPRGHRIAIACNDLQIRLWDAGTGRPVTSPWAGHHDGGIQLAFNHAGDRVLSGDWSSILRLWDAGTGRLLLSKPGLPHMQFSSDDHSLGIQSAGDKYRILRVAGGQELRTLHRPTPHGSERFLSFGNHPDGRLLAVKTETGISFFDLLNREEIAFIAGDFERSLVFDTKGALWTPGGAGLVRWPVKPVAGIPSRLRIGPPEWVADVLQNGHDGFGISANGQVVVVPRYSQGALVLHRGPPRSTLLLGPQYDVRHVCVSPEGRWVVTTTHWNDGSGVRFKVWEAITGKHVANLPFPFDSLCHGFSPDGRWLYVSGKESQRLEIASLTATAVPSDAPAAPPGPPAWQQGWRSERVRLGGAFSPVHRLRAYGIDDGSIRLVVPETDEEIARLPSPEVGWIYPTQFSPDGSLLLAHGEETGALYVFDLRRIRTQLAELGLDWDLPPYPPTRPEETNPALSPLLQVTLIDAEWATSKSKMAEYESKQSVARLFLNPFDADAHYRLGERLLDAGKPQPAFAHLTTALAFRPELDEARLARTRSAFHLGCWADAVANATRCLEKSPWIRDARLLRAQAEMKRKHYEKAVGDFDVLIKAYPTDSRMYELRAECQEALGKPDEAKADRAQARKVGVCDPETLNSQAWKLVTGLAGQRDPVQALKLIQEALQHRPENATFLNTLGVVQYRNGQFKEALTTLENSFAAGQGQADACDLFFLAMCHARLGDPSKANDCFDRAVRWWAGRKDLSAQSVTELTAFRAEAEAVLKGKAD